MPRLSTRTALQASLFLLLARALARSETVLDGFPLVLEAGIAVKEAPELAGTLLADLPFKNDQGYGYVGGRAERLTGAAASGGSPSWPLAWREGVEKYVFRVPRGEYLVEMSFLETDVACRGLRVFDVLAEERELFPRLDIVAKAGDF